MIGIVVRILAAFLNLQLIVLQEFSIIFEDIRVLVLGLGLMLSKGFVLFTLLSLAVFIDLVAVSIVLQYSNLLVLSLLRSREVFVVHEFALAVDRTVFERLNFLAILAAPLLRVLMLPDVDVFECSAVLFNFFEDVRRRHADLGLSLRVFGEQHLEIFFHVDRVVVKDVVLGRLAFGSEIIRISVLLFAAGLANLPKFQRTSLSLAENIGLMLLLLLFFMVIVVSLVGLVLGLSLLLWLF